MSKRNTIKDVLARLEITELDWCWEWLGYTHKGYGQIDIAGRTRVVHEVMFEHFVGPVPEGLELDHVCRNRRCANPNHLEVITHQENVRRGASGVQKGESNFNCTLTEEQVTYIMARLLVSKESQRAIARIFGISGGAIQDIWHLRSWAYLWG